MNGEWGVEVGYISEPSYITDSKKTLLDWQEGSDCCALAALSQPSIVHHNCCGPGSTPMQFTVSANCCPAGYIMNPIDRLCYYPGSVQPITSVPCQYCPTGYTYSVINSIAGCRTPGSSVIVVVNSLGTHCVAFDGARYGEPTQACPGKFYPFTITQYAHLPETSTPCSPFQPLFSGGRYKPCPVI